MRDDVTHALDSLDTELSIHHRVLKTKTIDKKGFFAIKVSKKMHILWHEMFGSENEKTICYIIDRYLSRSDFEFSCQYLRNFSWVKSIDNEMAILCINSFSTEKIENIKRLWDKFCDGRKPFDVCRYINRYFVNPRCRFVCRRKKGYCRIRPYNAYGKNKSNKR